MYFSMADIPTLLKQLESADDSVVGAAFMCFLKQFEFKLETKEDERLCQDLLKKILVLLNNNNGPVFFNALHLLYKLFEMPSVKFRDLINEFYVDKEALNILLNRLCLFLAGLSKKASPDALEIGGIHFDVMMYLLCRDDEIKAVVENSFARSLSLLLENSSFIKKKFILDVIVQRLVRYHADDSVDSVDPMILLVFSSAMTKPGLFNHLSRLVKDMDISIATESESESKSNYIGLRALVILYDISKMPSYASFFIEKPDFLFPLCELFQAENYDIKARAISFLFNVFSRVPAIPPALSERVRKALEKMDDRYLDAEAIKISNRLKAMVSVAGALGAGASGGKVSSTAPVVSALLSTRAASAFRKVDAGVASDSFCGKEVVRPDSEVRAIQASAFLSVSTTGAVAGAGAGAGVAAGAGAGAFNPYSV